MKDKLSEYMQEETNVFQAAAYLESLAKQSAEEAFVCIQKQLDKLREGESRRHQMKEWKLLETLLAVMKAGKSRLIEAAVKLKELEVKSETTSKTRHK